MAEDIGDTHGGLQWNHLRGHNVLTINHETMKAVLKSWLLSDFTIEAEITNVKTTTDNGGAFIIGFKKEDTE